MTRWRTLLLFGVAACGFVNPLARTREGKVAKSRMRAGVAAATLEGDCTELSVCSVQIEMGHFANEAVRVEVVGVRLFVGDRELGRVPVGEPLRWRHGEYRAWDHVVEPSRSTKLSIPIGAIAWDRLLAPLPGSPDPQRLQYGVAVDVVVDGEQLAVESIFTVGAASERVFVVT